MSGPQLSTALIFRPMSVNLWGAAGGTRGYGVSQPRTQRIVPCRTVRVKLIYWQDHLVTHLKLLVLKLLIVASTVTVGLLLSVGSVTMVLLALPHLPAASQAQRVTR